MTQLLVHRLDENGVDHSAQLAALKAGDVLYVTGPSGPFAVPLTGPGVFTSPHYAFPFDGFDAGEVEPADEEPVDLSVVVSGAPGSADTIHPGPPSWPAIPFTTVFTSGPGGDPEVGLGVTVIHPTVNADATPLDDLAYTRVEVTLADPLSPDPENPVPDWPKATIITIPADRTSVVAMGMRAGRRYYARARSFDTSGNESTLTTPVIEYVTRTDSEAPGMPQSVELTSGYRGIGAHWQGSDARDLMFYELRYAKALPGTTSDVFVGSVGGPGQIGVPAVHDVWFDGSDVSRGTVGGNSETTWDVGAPVAVYDIRIRWAYGTMFGGGAAGAFQMWGSNTAITGPWTSVLVDGDPVGALPYPGDFEHTYHLPAPVTYRYWRFRSTTAGNNDIFTVGGLAPAVGGPGEWDYIRSRSNTIFLASLELNLDPVANLPVETLYWVQVRAIDFSGNVVTSATNPTAVPFDSNFEAGWTALLSQYASPIGADDIGANTVTANMISTTGLDASIITGGLIRMTTSAGYADGIEMYAGGVRVAMWTEEGFFIGGATTGLPFHIDPTTGMVVNDFAGLSYMRLTDAGLVVYRDGVPYSAITPKGIDASVINFGNLPGGHNIVKNTSFELAGFVAGSSSAPFDLVAQFVAGQVAGHTNVATTYTGDKVAMTNPNY